MSISIQTNVASLNAQRYISQNQIFQNTAIQQLSSGYKINSSADDPAGLATANQYAGEITQLTQGVQNANDGGRPIGTRSIMVSSERGAISKAVAVIVVSVGP